ncbi:MAG TPA: HAD family hydrolase [Acidimicrobiales bacterium]|nr:HAD family hydrolase [Acidimicrobiales bacterium]
MIFDLDDTLILDTGRECYRAAATTAGMDPEVVAPAAERIARALWRESPHVELGVELGIASWEVLWAEFTGCHPRVDGLRDWAPGYRGAVWQKVAAKCRADIAKASILERAYVAAHRAGHPQIPGALDLVQRLHRSGVPIGILTNGPADIQRLKLQQFGAMECFATTVVSGEVGVGKPDPSIFRMVLEGLGTLASDTVMIGDSWVRDIEGAESVGMRSIWVGSGRTVRRQVEGMSVVTSTAEAGALLGC